MGRTTRRLGELLQYLEVYLDGGQRYGRDKVWDLIGQHATFIIAI